MAVTQIHSGTEDVTTAETSPQSVALRTKALTKHYGSTVAVEALTLSVRRGEVYGFLGPNGAGKTTTLRMLVGLVRPTAGSAEVLGMRPGDPAGLARLGAMVETPAFYPYLSGHNNLELLALHAHVPVRRVAVVLEMTGLASRAGDRFGHYSLGMKQRLGVAAALLKDPQLLILDEPTNGLDPPGMADMSTLIRRLGDEGKAVLLSSHNLPEVQQICDRVGVIFNGKLVAESTVAELRSSDALVVIATPIEMAERRLVELLGREHVSVAGLEIRLDVGRERAAWLNRELMVAGIAVEELRREERSLEEVFMAMNATYGDHRGGSDAR
jgi:ABC-2 type transport system ATP-binding protein